jgi:hypothetical protein
MRRAVLGGLLAVAALAGCGGGETRIVWKERPPWRAYLDPTNDAGLRAVNGWAGRAFEARDGHLFARGSNGGVEAVLADPAGATFSVSQLTAGR